MNSTQIQQTENEANFSPPTAAVGGYSQASISGGFFALFAVELFLLGFVVWSYLINRHSFPNNSSDIADPVWGLIGLAAAGWGTWFLLKFRQTLKRWQLSQALNFLTIVVGSGTILLGILLVNVARVFVADPGYLDVRPQYALAASKSKTAEAAAMSGNAANGKKWFAMTCVTCHGPTGDGVLNAAPSLRTSEFLKKANDQQIAALIRLGRAANDPANKTGKVMPAKGGNPFLDESKIADLVAFLKDLEAQLPSAPAAGPPKLPDVSATQKVPSDQPPAIVRNWKLEDLTSLDLTPSEESFSLGMQAFMKAGCNQCHMAVVAGQELGPPLDQIAKKYERKELVKHMVEPSLEINEKFKSHCCELVDGRTVTGIMVAKTDEQILLMTDMLKPEELESIRTDDIDDAFEVPLSPMPRGLLDVLTLEEIAALVTYVDVVGRQMGESPAAPLNRWVVPEATSDAMPTKLASLDTDAAHPRHWMTMADALRTRNAKRYEFTFSWLFVTATAVLAMHFLWVIGSGTAIVMHRELQLTWDAQTRLLKPVFLFWSWGVVWLLIWFVVFFLFR